MACLGDTSLNTYVLLDCMYPNENVNKCFYFVRKHSGSKCKQPSNDVNAVKAVTKKRVYDSDPEIEVGVSAIKTTVATT